MKKYSMAAAATVVVLGIFSVNVSAQANQTTISNKDKAVALLNSIHSGYRKAAYYVNPKKYIQHNPGVADGLAGFGEVLQALPKGSAKVNVVRTFQDGDYVFTHTDYDFFGPKVGFDIFRFEDGKIVEHWDNLAEKSTSPNPSGRTQLDGATELKDLDKTQENKALVADFVDTILVNGHFDKLAHFIEGDNYIQHNTQIADGLSGLNNALEAMAKQGTTMTYKTNHIVLGEGNFVLSVSEGGFGGKAVSFYDLFRVEAGKIVEHWDVIEPILPKQQWKNTNGKFGFEHDYVVEVATFDLKNGVNPKAFAKLDQQVADTYVSKQPGFISRISELTKENYWRVIVHWESLKDSDASMASFMDEPAAKAFLEGADTSTMVMRRYKN